MTTKVYGYAIVNKDGKISVCKGIPLVWASHDEASFNATQEWGDKVVKVEVLFQEKN